MIYDVFIPASRENAFYQRERERAKCLHSFDDLWNIESESIY
jgi:hypothetical protein